MPDYCLAAHFGPPELVACASGRHLTLIRMSHHNMLGWGCLLAFIAPTIVPLLPCIVLICTLFDVRKAQTSSPCGADAGVLP